MLLKNTLFAVLISALAYAQVDTALFQSIAFTEPVSIVNCTLEDGTQTQCYELKFYANNVNDDGPFCPPTISDVGGMGVYEPGASGTNVGLAAIDSVLLSIIEADGFDIVQPDGTVNINAPGTGNMPSPGLSYCLQAIGDDDLELVYLIPVTPHDLSTPNIIQTVEQLGVSLQGVPLKGYPPAVIGGGPGGGGPGGGSDVLMPALDACGGHHDPFGYYHWHLIANSTNTLLSDLNITAVSCTSFPQDNSGLMGFAMDGYPIYGQFDAGNTVPSGLDACNGHVGPTAEYPAGVYHYHALQGDAPNIPPCLKGASANNNFTYSFHQNDLSARELEAVKMTVYPNPATEEVHIQTKAEEIQVIDATGRSMDVLSRITPTGDGFHVSTIGWSPGIYYIVAKTSDHSSVERLLIGTE